MVLEGNHYPDDQIEALVSLLGERYQLRESQVMITAGSTEMLSLLGHEVALRGKSVLMSEDSFPTLAIFAERQGARIHRVPIRPDYRIDLEGMKKAVDADTGLIFLCNPNNPTSTDHDPNELLAFVEQVPENVLVCVDEAYIQYSRKGESGSLVEHVSSMPNLVVLRTFSKAFGLAGMRIGYSYGPVELMHKLRQSHLGFNMANSRVAVAAAREALKSNDHIDMVIKKNNAGRKIVYDAFANWGVGYGESATNFIYAQSDRFETDVRRKLRKDGIMITQWPGMTDHIRISIGKPSWMQTFVDAIEQYLV